MFNGPDHFNSGLGVSRPRIRPFDRTGMGGCGNLRPFCAVPRGVGDHFSRGDVQRVLCCVLARPSLRVPRALPSGVISRFTLVSHSRTLQTVRFPSDRSSMTGTHGHLGFRRLFCVRLSVVHAAGLHRVGCTKCVFRHINRCFGHFCHRYVPFSLASTRGHIVHRVHTSVVAKGRVGHLLRNSINDNGAIITVVATLVTLSGNCRTYVVTPARVLTARRCTNVSTRLTPLNIEIRLLANDAAGGQHRAVVKSLGGNRVRVLVNARTLVRSDIIFRGLKFIIVSRRRHFNITRHTGL